MVTGVERRTVELKWRRVRRSCSFNTKFILCNFILLDNSFQCGTAFIDDLKIDLNDDGLRISGIKNILFI